MAFSIGSAKALSARRDVASKFAAEALAIVERQDQ
jgi:hypothetical protein